MAIVVGAALLLAATWIVLWPTRSRSCGGMDPGFCRIPLSTAGLELQSSGWAIGLVVVSAIVIIGAAAALVVRFGAQD